MLGAPAQRQQRAVAPRRRPTPSSSERALLPPLPLTALPSSQAVPSRFLMATDCMRWRAVMGATAQRRHVRSPCASKQVGQDRGREGGGRQGGSRQGGGREGGGREGGGREGGGGEGGGGEGGGGEGGGGAGSGGEGGEREGGGREGSS